MKLQIIFSFYINPNKYNNWIYQMHYDLLEKCTSKVDRTIFIISYDHTEVSNDDVRNVRLKLADICKSNEMTFILCENDKRYREGIIFKRYIIDKLNDYNDYLTFFGHTKGVSNELNWKNIDNLKFWIYSMYYMNFIYIEDTIKKLTNPYEKYICYGTGFYPSYTHNNNHNWFYSGSFCWVNTNRLNDYIKENNIDINKYVISNNENLMRCAELFLGYVCPREYAGFLHDENFNKEYDPFTHYKYMISYEEYDAFLKMYMQVDDFFKLQNEYNQYINVLNENCDCSTD